MDNEATSTPQTNSYVTTSGSQLGNAIFEALDWADEVRVVCDGPSTDGGSCSFWRWVTEASNKLDAIFLGLAEETEAELLAVLGPTGKLHVPQDREARLGNLVWCRRGEEVRLFASSTPLTAKAFTSVSPPWFCFQGDQRDLPRGVDALFAQLGETSVAITGEVWKSWLRPNGPAVYRRPLRNVRRELPNASFTSGFSSLSEDEQTLSLWTTLIGEGTLDLDPAIRLAAQRLRAQGVLEYHALRQAGDLYQLLKTRLLEGRRKGAWFDRPKPGHIRAIELNVELLTADDWRDCLLSSLRDVERVERSEAIRFTFDYARNVYGIDAQRLRTGGRAERAIRSAINSAVRQGFLQRDGAMYLLVHVTWGEPIVAGEATDTLETPATTQTTNEASLLPVIDETDSSIPRHPLISDMSLETAPANAWNGDSTDAAPLVSAAVVETRPADAGPAVGPSWAVIDPAAPSPHVEPVLAPWLTRSSDAPASSRRPALLHNEEAPPASVRPSPSLEPKPLFERSLRELEFPTRTLNWADARGITTIGQLVAWNPAEVVQERNMGRLTLERTRAALEQALGCTWEAAWRAHEQRIVPDAPEQGDEESTTAVGAVGWAAMAANLSPEDQQTPLTELDLPARMRNVAAEQGLKTLGELVALNAEELRALPNLGRKSINDTLDAIADYLTERQTPQQHANFLALWKAQLSGLKPMHRMVLSRRSGMMGTRETLEQLGAILGISRERVRQLEVSTLNRLAQKNRLQREILSQLDAAFGSANAIPVVVLDQEEWWRGVADKMMLLEFVFERVLNNQVFLFTAPSGALFVTKFPPAEFEERLDAARARIAALEFPCEYESVHHILHDEATLLDVTLLDELETAVRKSLVMSEDEGRVLGVRIHRDDEVLAFLNAQEGPVPVSLIEEKFGRGRIPDAALYFKRGWIGAQRHFPDFDEWQNKLVPECLSLMQTRPEGRQWLIPDLHEELLTKGLVPEWLGHWHLASLLRKSDQVEYLGRLRVALRGSAAERLQFEDVFLDLLTEAGRPLPKDELLAKARERTDVREATALVMLKEAPFVRLDDSLIGLVERDVPGGAEAVAQAIAVVTDHLTNTQVGLTPFQAQQLIAHLSDVHRTWSLPLVKSLLRSEPTLRIDRSKNVGLAEWDDARFPARAEFLRREVLQNNGQMSVEELSERMQTVFGTRPERAQLAVLANQVRLTLDGPHIRLPHPDSAPHHAAPEPETATHIAGIPVELQQTLTELMREEALDAVTLSAQVDAHLRAFEREYRINEFVELTLARRLTEQAKQLLTRWNFLTPGQKRIAQAAIRYFVLVEDVESDFDIGGLDDDAKVMGAVLEHLGIAAYEPNAAM
jgi:plasmid stabilization system protein ParE